MKFIIWNIDHVISDASWRDKMLPPNNTYDEYHAELINDKPFTNVIELIDKMQADRYINIGITARPEKWRMLSNQWFIKHKVRLTEIMMRPDSDFSNVVDSKIALIEKTFEGDRIKDVCFYVDDRDDCCVAIAEKFCISTLQIRHNKTGM